MSFTIRLSRTVAKRSSADVAKKMLAKVLAACCRIHYHISVKTIKVALRDTGHVSEIDLTGRVSDEYKGKFVATLAALLSSRFDPPWVIMGEGEGALEVTSSEGGESTVEVAERPIGAVNTDIPPETFNRLYGREAQIRRIIDAIHIGKDTNWTKRKHTLLSGPPGTGKTELLLTLARALGQEGESWLWFDATSTTKAGALEQLMKAPMLPPILFVEEIEKVQENSLRWLLSVMDERGEIRRTNYRVGNQVKQVRLTIIATANNVSLLQAMDAGAIYSRFGNRIHCPPPDREVLHKILLREVTEVGGKYEWAEAALQFGHDELHIQDCREILNILLCGRDRLLTGEYQQDFLSTLPPEDLENLKASKSFPRYTLNGKI